MLWFEIRLRATSFVVAALAANAAKTWVSLPIRGPARLADYSLNRHQADVSIGTPPQNTSFVVSISLIPLYTLTPQCLFCPPEGMYDLRYSSSAKRTPEIYTGRNTSGTYGTEAITLGGVLQDEHSPLIFIDRMAPYHSLRYTGGLLGLFVPPTNAATRAKNLVHRLYEQGQLLNPVWGLRLSGENPRLTIGALDPNEYQGEINWVPMLPTEDGSPAIQIDSLRGYQGNVVPLQYPITAYLDSITRSINLPDLGVVLTQAILGPQPIYRDQSGGFAVACNNSETPNHPVEFSVGINGVVYPIKQSDLVRAESSLSPARNTCYVGIHESPSDDSSFLLGITFLRSVYVAYRLPSETCPGYWGFATPRGSPVASPTQTPKTTPTDVDKCLSLVKPTSTPTPTIASYTGLLGSDGKEYQIHARPDEQWVQLRGADELKERKVTGGKAGFGG